MPDLFQAPPYLQKFGLKEPPYSTNADERFLFLTDNHQEAISTAAQVINDREGAALIYGEKGTGKTTILRRLWTEMQHLPGQFHVVSLEAPDQSPTPFQLVKAVIEGFGGECKANNRKERFDQLKALLLADYQKGIIPVVLIDEVHRVPAEALESLRSYLNFETATEKVLQIILFANPEITRKLAYVPSLKNRLVRTELKRMTQSDMEEMLRWRFMQAGGKVFPFEPAALSTLFSLTKGHPRLACGIARWSLITAAKSNTYVTSEIIIEASKKRFLD